MIRFLKILAVVFVTTGITGITAIPTQAGHEGSYKVGTIKEVSRVSICSKEVAQEALSALPDWHMLRQKKSANCNQYSGPVYVVEQDGVDVLDSGDLPWRSIHVRLRNKTGLDRYLLTYGPRTIVVAE